MPGMQFNWDFQLSRIVLVGRIVLVIYRAELDCRVQKKGKLSTSHRYDLLPLLRSSPGGVWRELVVYDFPDCTYSYFLSTCKIFTILNSFFKQLTNAQDLYRMALRILSISQFQAESVADVAHVVGLAAHLRSTSIIISHSYQSDSVAYF